MGLLRLSTLPLRGQFTSPPGGTRTRPALLALRLSAWAPVPVIVRVRRVRSCHSGWHWQLQLEVQVLSPMLPALGSGNRDLGPVWAALCICPIVHTMGPPGFRRPSGNPGPNPACPRPLACRGGGLSGSKVLPQGSPSPIKPACAGSCPAHRRKAAFWCEHKRGSILREPAYLSRLR